MTAAAARAAVLRRGLASGWKGLLIATAAVAAMLALGLAVYRDIDLTLYERLPEAVRALAGIPAHADASLIAYNEMLASIGALAFVGVAISIGARAVAGEEEARTLHLALARPISRTGYVAGRGAAMIALIVAGGALLWAVAEIAPRVLGAETGDAHLFALVAHLTAAAVFHASLAFAVGAATGRRAAAGGVAAAVMVLGWLGAGLLPMWREGAADWIPWSWFNGATPLVNGVDGARLALLLGGTLVLLALGALAFRARDLRLTAGTPSLLERLRAMPRVGRVLAPTGRGSSFFGLRLAAEQMLLAYVVFVVGLLMGVSMPLLYRSLSRLMGDFAATFPQTLADLFGGGNLGTAAGFLHLEIFGMVAPAAVILVATVAASSGIGGEERARRMSLLLAQPISRSRVYGTVAAATAVAVLVVAVALFLGSWAGIAIAGIDVSIAHLAGVCALLTLTGWCFGGLALLVTAATGRAPLAVWATAGAAVASYFGYTLLLASGHGDAAWWSPMRAYLAGPPLVHGIAWWQPVWLAVAAVALTVAGLPLFSRRDLRLSGG
ncbi:ABC transporter permease [Leucobacter sp. gxy201]|uniref:ABC transporter permease subunit n=1 Tax=Leucobacter sp. gxy201 TaxID=2957200 RepID=UPI003D9FD048